MRIASTGSFCVEPISHLEANEACVLEQHRLRIEAGGRARNDYGWHRCASLIDPDPLGWECPHCAGRLELDVRPVDVGGEGLVNVLEAWCEVCAVRWFPPRALHLQREHDVP